ncbi:phosphate ABC transporter ATP-binding protein [Desulfoscipio sp. XC116]|uniref:phosphate ABC transporter ATP-binding protein n=1 Tax=Desulfoscipio sp. XC116 TaxID=3144975 RepID=UPI00325BF6F7
MSLIIENFNAWYGKGQILKDINLEFKEKSIFAIVGPSGCGKTTLLRSVNRTAGLDKAFRGSGQILLAGTNIYASKDAADIRRRVGLVFQTPVALPLSIKENVLFGPRYYGAGKKQLPVIVEKCLFQAGLWDEVKDKLNKPAAKLSGGQKQRLAIARTLAVEPDVLLLDEPCSNLDPASTLLIEKLLVDLSAQLTIVIVTHNLFQAKRVAQETVFMADGWVVECGTTEAMFNQPRKEATRAFFSGLMW